MSLQNLRKRRTATRTPIKPPTAAKAVEQEAPKAPQRRTPVRKATTVPKKEVKPIEQEKEVVIQSTEAREQREPDTRKEASKPPTSEGSKSKPAESRPAHQRADGRVTSTEMRAMEHDARYKLFLSLNKRPDKFIPICHERPKSMQMRKDEAILRNIVPPKAPKGIKGSAGTFFCPYCVDWQVYHSHVWIGYNKCTGCSISTKDFYVAADNGLFGKE